MASTEDEPDDVDESDLELDDPDLDTPDTDFHAEGPAADVFGSLDEDLALWGTEPGAFTLLPDQLDTEIDPPGTS
jgi:hypothetical protein